MNRTKKILQQFNLGGIMVCLFFYLFTKWYSTHTELNITFLISVGVLLLNALLIQHEKMLSAAVVFIAVANMLLLLFDTGIMGPTRTFIFYIPLLLCAHVFIELKHKNLRYALTTITLLCIVAVNIEGLTPRWAFLLSNPIHLEISTYFNVVLGIIASFGIFNILINQYLKAERLLLKEEDRLKKSQDFIKSINQNIDVGICRTHAELDKLIYVNRANATMFGYASESEMMNIEPAEMYANEIDRKFIIDQLKKNGIIQNFEVEFKRKNGSKFWGLLTTSVYIDAEGNKMYDGVVRDITELKRVREELTKAKNLAEEASIAKSKFLSAMSHEIRTPMNAVIGITELMLMGGNDKETEKVNLNVLKNSAQNLMRLLNNTLDFTKIEAGKMDLINKPADIAEMIHETCSIYSNQAVEKDLTLLTNIDSLDKKVMIDKTRIMQVLSNLLSNAIKFTNKGTVTIGTSILQKDQAAVTIKFYVSDTGIGIDSSMKENIFQAFRQENYDISTAHGGSGLGLAISRKILEMMNSKFELESKRDEGSTFSFTLKLPIVVSENKQTPSATPTEVTSFKGMRILLVEDTPVNVLVAKQILTKWDCEVDTAVNGQLAIDKLKIDSKYGIILMDLHMPVLDGIKASKEIRKMGIQVPIIALTADALNETRNECLRAGMNDYVTKPFNPKDLHLKIRQYATAQNN
jgi:PAS domain S-box-containing protein